MDLWRKSLAACMFAALIPCVGFPAEVAPVPQEMSGLPLVFQEDFSKGMDRWVMTDPNAWKIEEADGNPTLSLYKASVYAPPFRSPLCIARIKDLKVSDFIIEARIEQTGKEYAHRDSCVFFGYNDPAHFYYVHIATQSDPHANSIFLVNNAARVSIAKERNQGNDWGTGYHLVRVERRTESGTIKVFFDDMTQPVMIAEDKTFPAGELGVGSFDDVGRFDDIRVWGKTE